MVLLDTKRVLLNMRLYREDELYRIARNRTNSAASVGSILPSCGTYEEVLETVAQVAWHEVPNTNTTVNLQCFEAAIPGLCGFGLLEEVPDQMPVRLVLRGREMMQAVVKGMPRREVHHCSMLIYRQWGMQFMENFFPGIPFRERPVRANKFLHHDVSVKYARSLGLIYYLVGGPTHTSNNRIAA